MSTSALLHYLRVPLGAAPLLLIGLFGVMVSLAEHAGLLGVPALVILGSWFFTYGFALLDHVIEGRADAPVLSYEMANPLATRPLGMFLLVLGFYLASDALRPWIGGSGILLLRLFAIALVPAMVAAMSLRGRFTDGLHPAAVFGIIARMPVAYAVLLVGLVAVWFLGALIARTSAATFAALWHPESLMPGRPFDALGLTGSLVGMVDQMFFMYLWLATFALIGGSIYEGRFELGIDVAASPESKAARAEAAVKRQQDRIWDQVFGQLRSGALKNARDSVAKLIAQSRQPLEECRWLYERAVGQPDQRLANYLAQLTLTRLLEARATGEAVRLVRERLTRQPQFRPQTAAQCLSLARLARDAGDRRTARQLVADFETHYPENPLQSVAAQLQSELEH